MENKRRTYGDETMYEITPIEMHLSSRWNRDEAITGTLHSEFERVQNYLFEIDGERRMLTMMREGNELLPDSMILHYEDYNYLKYQGEFLVIKSKDYIQIHNIKITLLNTSSCSLLNLSVENFKKEYLEQKKKQIEKFIAYSGKKSDFERLPKRYTNLLQSFIEGVLENNKGIAETSFLHLVGAGKGLTPAADDALVGALSGILFALALQEKTELYLERVEMILPHLTEKKLTTEISSKYLKCACCGDFSKTLCSLIRFLAGEESEDLMEKLTQIAQTGHSSGMDMLYGLQKTLDYIWQKWKGEKWNTEL